MNALCVYHAPCQDGFAAAWVVRRALKGEVDFQPGVHGEKITEYANRHVIFVDFCPPQAELEKIIDEALHVTVIDHHKTCCLASVSMIRISDRRKFDWSFGNELAGCMATWRWFFDEEQAPKVLQHINDRDLWKFDMPGTREVCTALFSYPYDFQVWDEFMLGIDVGAGPRGEKHWTVTDWGVSKLREEGKVLERKHWQDISTLLPIATQMQEIAGYRVPVANLPPTMVSDAANELSKGQQFAACYYDTPGWRNYSLRSTQTGLDVSEIAKQFGGGGHARAAGFRIRAEWGKVYNDQERTGVPPMVYARRIIDPQG